MVFANKLTELFKVYWTFKPEQAYTLAYRKRSLLDSSSHKVTIADKRGVVVEILNGYYLLLEGLSMRNEHQVKSLCKFFTIGLCGV
jgi:hypothetical protein